jgi:hypothetical protein
MLQPALRCQELLRYILGLVALALIAHADPPASNIIVDTSNSVTSGLKLLVYPGTTTNKNIVNGDAGTLMGSASWRGTGPSGGSALVTTGGKDGAYWPLSNPGIYGSGAHDWTVFVRSKIIGWGGAYATIAGIPQNATLASPSYSIALRRDNTTTAPAAHLTSNPSFQEYHAGNTGFFIIGSWHTYALVKSGNTVLFYRDGVQFGSSVGMASDFAIGWGSSPQPFTLFNLASTASGNGPVGSADVAAVWSRALSAAELASLTAKPYQLVTTPPPTYTISGTVTSTGANAKITLTGGSVNQAVIADGSGNYTFTPVIAGTYTVAPARLGINFTPSSQSVTPSGNQTVTFTAASMPTGPATIKLQGLTQSQAGIIITGAGGNSCKLNLFRGNSIDGAPHPDAINSVDTTRSDTITTSNGRLVWLGHNLDELALFEGEQHFVHANCGAAGQATLTFVTPHPPTTATPAPPVPFDSSRPYNYGGPLFDISQAGQKVALPYTGVAAEIPIGPFDRWWETIFNDEGLGFFRRLGGNGWTIPSGSLDGTSSPRAYATTSNTNPVILLPEDNTASRHNPIGFAAETAGIQIWGSGDNSTDVNRVINVCITTNMVAGTCDSNTDPKYYNGGTPWFQVTLNAGTNGPVSNTTTLAASMSTRGNTPWPAAYPTPGFIGWNTFVPVERLTVKEITISGISSGVVSATNTWGDKNYIPEGLKGNYLYIPGLSNANCPGDMCPVADVLPNGQVQLASPANTITDARSFTNAIAYQYGFKIWKATATGTINIASRYTLAGRIGQTASVGTTAICSKVPKTINGKKGSNCLFTTYASPKHVIWIPDNRNDRALYRTSLAWSTGASFSNITNANDRPNGERPSGDAYWDGTDPDTLYVYNQTHGGAYSIFKGVLDSNPPTDPAACITNYTSTCRTTYAQTYSGDSAFWQTGHVLWTNLTPASATPAMDIASQINRSHPSYAKYPDYSSNGWQWVGVSGNIGYMKANGGVQDSKPCLISAFDLTQTPARLIRFLSTMSDANMLAETNGGIEEMRWGGCHGVFEDVAFPNSVVISNEVPGAPNHAGPGYLGAPAMFKPIAVMAQDGVTWIANTSLQWPPPPAGGSSASLYKSDYPGPYSDFKARVRRYIYARNQFVRIKAAGSGNASTTNWICSASTDLAKSGAPVCKWDGAKHALPFTWKPIEGDAFTFSGNSQCVPGDGGTCEQFVIAKINSISNTEVDFWAIRSAVRYYACPKAGEMQINGSVGPGIGPGCVNTPLGRFNQNAPPNGWLGNMIPGIQSPEYAKRLQLNLDGSVANMIVQAGEFFGHSTAGIGMDGNTYLIGYTTAVRVTKMSDLNALYYTGNLPSYHQPGTERAGFAGMQKQAMTQSYMTASGYRSDAVYRGSGVDLHHIANGGGGVDCTIANGCDKLRTLTPVAGMTNVYKYVHSDFSSGTVYKYRSFFPIYAVGGPHIFKDRSGPTCDMNTAPDYTICFNYRTGITSGVAGSAVGNLYIKAPAVQYSSTEFAVNSSIDTPYATFLGPTEGGLRQFMWETDDFQGGRWQRFLGYTGPPGFTQGFSEPSLSTYGSKVLTHTANFANGTTLAPLVVHLPDQSTFMQDSSKVNLPAFKSGSRWTANFEIRLDAYPGATAARVKFGTTPAFNCTEASEACVTDESHTSYNDSFAWIGEASNPTACSSGCTLHPPLVPGTLYVIQVQRLDGSGNVIKTEDTQFATVR